MLSRHDGRWSITCGRCLETLPDVTGTRDDAVNIIEAEAWELRPSDQVWCLPCSRTAREVKPYRGRRRR